MLRLGASVLCLQSPQRMRNYSLKALLCMRMTFPYTISIEWTWAEPLEMNIKRQARLELCRR